MSIQERYKREIFDARMAAHAIMNIIDSGELFNESTASQAATELESAAEVLSDFSYTIGQAVEYDEDDDDE